MKLTKRTDNQTNRLPVSHHDPFRSLSSVQEAMNRLFSDSFMVPFHQSFGELGHTYGSFAPKVDVSETDTEIKVRAELPGLDPKDVVVEVTEDTISISGKLEKSLEEKQENYYRMERSAGQFSREFALPAKIETENVRAEAKHGVLTVSLQKQPSEQRRKVTIES